MPSPAERAGDLSAIARTIVDPLTGQPFLNNQIPASRISPATQKLLSLFPLPNQAGDVQNFHSVTTTTSDLDDINIARADFPELAWRHATGAEPLMHAHG